MTAWFLVSVFFSLLVAAYPQATTHIVYLGSKDESTHPDIITNSQYHLLESVLGSYEAARASLIYSYRHGFNGFAAHLTQEQAHQISSLPNVVSVFPSELHKVHTTDSWDFLGLSGNMERSLFGVANNSLWKDTNYGEDIIIGVLDSGIWPESPSFTDDSMSPIPLRWKGSCEYGELFDSSSCNRKLIGARFFLGGYVNDEYVKENRELLSPRDVHGHGTHTASTAGGTFVKNANWQGYANGIAKGGAPMSRIAAYKVCWRDGFQVSCPSESVLAGFDMGIRDGVDVFSVSLGMNATDYLNAVAIGAFHAVQKGIVVVASAGNSGPESGTLENVAPWIITVAASTIDRNFYTNVFLGNNVSFPGLILAKHKPENEWYSLISGADAAANSSSPALSQFCAGRSLDFDKVKNKIVACLLESSTSYDEVELAGGAGMILYGSPNSNILESIATGLNFTSISIVYTSAKEDKQATFSYINSTQFPQAYISDNVTSQLKEKPAPVIARFSSRGPNTITSDILKPDIAAPGVDILAAYTGYMKYTLVSGTSMSCPHVSGISALLKSYRPDWSPAAIKSAILTTGFLTDNLGGPLKNDSLLPANPFDFGGGHINPNAAAHPGLIYDLNEQDYINFLCSLNYTSNRMRSFTQGNGTCPPTVPDASNLNYPSIAISNLRTRKTVTRKVTNVDDDATTYRATVIEPKGISVTVDPSQLEFKRKGETRSFEVTFEVKEYFNGYQFGYLTWSNSKYLVRSPISISVML